MIASPPVLILVALTGLALGSYVVTAGIRFARSEPSSFGRSHCDDCGTTLSFARTVPMASYLMSGGRCRECGAPIDPLHLIGEGAGVAILVSADLTALPLRALLLSLLGLFLLAAATIDWKTGRLPDTLTAGIAAAGATLAALSSWSALVIGGLSAVAAMGVLQGVRLVRSHGGRDPGLGLGDVKLFGALALWLGLQTPWMVAAAALIGLVAFAPRQARGERFAFGPAIAMGSWIVGLAMEARLWPTIM